METKQEEIQVVEFDFEHYDNVNHLGSIITANQKIIYDEIKRNKGNNSALIASHRELIEALMRAEALTISLMMRLSERKRFEADDNDLTKIRESISRAQDIAKELGR